MAQRGTFVWYELVTSDLDAAKTFYHAVIGWTARDSGQPDMTYLLLHAGEAPVAGLMEPPPGAPRDGFEPFWLGYVGVPDVDACTAQAVGLGARVHASPMDIPGVGRFAMLIDPQGAMIVPFKGSGSPPPAPPAGTPGHGGWHELVTSDWEAAFAFYAALFGWTKAEAIDMGPMGTYQVFAVDGIAIGGMLNAFDQSKPRWQYYFNVDGVEAAMARIGAAGGTLLRGPQQVPGGSWIAHATDPQGAFFAIVGAREVTAARRVLKEAAGTCGVSA